MYVARAYASVRTLCVRMCTYVRTHNAHSVRIVRTYCKHSTFTVRTRITHTVSTFYTHVRTHVRQQAYAGVRTRYFPVEPSGLLFTINLKNLSLGVLQFVLPFVDV